MTTKILSNLLESKVECIQEEYLLWQDHFNIHKIDLHAQSECEDVNQIPHVELNTTVCKTCRCISIGDTVKNAFKVKVTYRNMVCSKICILVCRQVCEVHYTFCIFLGANFEIGISTDHFHKIYFDKF